MKDKRRDIRVLAAYFVREITTKADQFTGIPYIEALQRAVEQLRPEIVASLKAANLTAEEMAQAMLVVA